MKNLLQLLGELLLGLAAAVWGVWALVYGDGWESIAKGAFAIILGAAFTAAMVYVIIQEAKAGTLISAPAHFKHEQAMEGAEVAAELPFALLQEQFRKLAEKDELACVEEEFLSWNDASSCGIRIYATGGDAWVAPCDLNSVTTIQGKDITALCRRHKVKLKDRTAIFNALVFYRDGKLTIYPKKMAERFTSLLRDPEHGTGILTTGSEFDQWLQDYTDDVE